MMRIMIFIVSSCILKRKMCMDVDYDRTSRMLKMEKKFTSIGGPVSLERLKRNVAKINPKFNKNQFL